MSRDEFTTVEEYNALQSSRYKIEGYGMDITVTVCCPFCCAPDFQSYNIFEVEQVTSKEHVCKVCTRGLKAVFKHFDCGTEVTMVQTCGPDSDVPWLPTITRA